MAKTLFSNRNHRSAGESGTGRESGVGGGRRRAGPAYSRERTRTVPRPEDRNGRRLKKQYDTGRRETRGTVSEIADHRAGVGAARIAGADGIRGSPKHPLLSTARSHFGDSLVPRRARNQRAEIAPRVPLSPTPPSYPGILPGAS